MWWYLCRKCLRKVVVGRAYIEKLPGKLVKEWLDKGDPRAICEFCRENPSEYYVDAETRSFSPSLLRKYGIR